jgi:CheY-like chemotaxis protein
MRTTQGDDAEPVAGAGHVVVLVVDDEQPIAEELALLVEDAGFTPRIAANGRQGLELARKERPALIFTDLMMSEVDGTELIAALRAYAEQDQHRPTPVILMTAGGLERAQAAGADVVLLKPFDISEVERLLRRFLGASQARARAQADDC